MTTSELGQVVRADHDYIDLLVNVKDEEDSTDDHETKLDSNRTEFARVQQLYGEAAGVAHQRHTMMAQSIPKSQSELAKKEM